MTLVLSARDLALLNDALTVVCAPYAHRSSGEWHAAVRTAMEPLLGDEGVADEVADGLRARRRVTPGHAAYAAMIDALPEAAVLCAPSGTLRHENPALRRLLAAEPRAAIVRAAIATAARALAGDAAVVGASATQGAADAPWHEVHGARTRYEVRGARVAQVREAAMIFLVRAAAARTPTDDELRARFALTTRELEVLHLLAVGRSAREVAAALELSYYTARHHVEHVMAKLGVRTRAAIAAAVAPH